MYFSMYDEYSRFHFCSWKKIMDVNVKKSLQSKICAKSALLWGRIVFGGRMVGCFFFILRISLTQPHFLQKFYRYLFWSAGHSGRFAIFRSSLSGSDQTLLVHSLLLVSDITISDVEKRVYWLDIGRETLETCTYDGTDRRVLKRSDSLLMLMSGLTLHKVYNTVEYVTSDAITKSLK